MTSETPFGSSISSLTGPSRQHRLKAALDQVVSAEAHRNELQLAYVRAGVLVLSLLLDLTVFLFPQVLLGKDQVPPTVVIISLCATLFSLLLVVILRQGLAMEVLGEVRQISPLAMGVGVHSGAVVAGCLGSSGRLEFTVIGDTVNVAARLEALTKTLGHALLVSESTQGRLPQWPLQSVGVHALRGRAQAMELFTL